MLPKTYTVEAARAGITQEEIEAANDRDLQSARTSLYAELNRVPALKAQAAEMLDVLLSGPPRAAIQNALDNINDAPTNAHKVAAARQLDQAIQFWAQAAVIDRDLARLAAPARAAEAQRQAAEERSRPKVLTVEDRLDRIEKKLGLA